MEWKGIIAEKGMFGLGLYYKDNKQAGSVASFFYRAPLI